MADRREEVIAPLGPALPDGESAATRFAIEVDGLRKRYGELEAVRGISFRVPAGETFGFLGLTAPASPPRSRSFAP
jgi:ABC-type uncharacterized transport system, ATPase component